MFVTILVVFTVFAGQLLRIQAFDASATQAAAFNKRLVQTLTPAMRGQILDTNGQVLADSVERYTIAANPKAIPAYKVKVDGALTQVGVAGAAAALAPLLDMSVSDLTPILTRPKTLYAIVKKEVNPAVYREIRALGIPGISGEKTAERIYPTAMAAGEIVGFVNPADQTASAGVEKMLDKTLAGTPGRTVAERARDGYIIPGSQRVDTPVVNGRDVKLTIDADLQWYTQNALAKQVTGVGAQSGTAVVIEVATGKIRAAASYPTYDSNDPAASKSNLANRAFWEAFEPGSTGKLMTMATALEQKIVTPDTGVIVPVRLPRAGIRFKDNEPHGVENMTATGVIAKSSNMGTMLIGERVAPSVLESYYRKFGVGAKTPVNFPGESAGQLAKAKDWNAAQRYTLLFGQGYSVTAVQATSVFATIANKGVRVPPSLIEGTVDDNGTFLPAAATTPTRVVSEDTAVKLSRMMEEVTGENGTASAARIKGYRVAGKTGTADRYDEALGRYNGFTASFIGYAPAEKPKYVVGVFIQKPSAGMFGGMLAGPVFNQVMTYLIERTAAPPSTKSDLDYHVWATKPLSENDPNVISNARAKRDGL
jgi:cell division protein FtsI (penicillin-binding protein 3)